MPNNDEDPQATILRLQEQLEEAQARTDAAGVKAGAESKARVPDYDTCQNSLMGSIPQC